MFRSPQFILSCLVLDIHNSSVNYWIIRVFGVKLTDKFFRQLEGEIAEEWNNPEADKNKLLLLIKSIVDFDMRHNAEIQACDLLMEIDQLELLHMDQSNYLRVCLYLAR